jgi:hypothetical protein
VHMVGYTKPQTGSGAIGNAKSQILGVICTSRNLELLAKFVSIGGFCFSGVFVYMVGHTKPQPRSGAIGIAKSQILGVISTSQDCLELLAEFVLIGASASSVCSCTWSGIPNHKLDLAR